MNPTLSLLSQAYRFAFPLVLMDATRRSAAGVNVLVHSRGLADADEKFVVTPNVDTVYSQLWLDLSRGPVVLTLPETDRYFTAQVMDAWTNTVCSLREAGDHVFARADQAGQAPDGMSVVEMPTAMGWLLIRVLQKDRDDLPRVRAIQEGMRVKELAGALPVTPQDDGDQPVTVPIAEVRAMDLAAFFARANALMRANPPAPADAPMMEMLAPLGVGPGLDYSGPTDAESEKAVKAALFAEVAALTRPYGVALGQWFFFGKPIGDFETAYDCFLSSKNPKNHRQNSLFSQWEIPCY
jgi:hypothetical protein